MGKYNLKENNVRKDPLHVETHNAVAAAINDLDSRAEELETEIDRPVAGLNTIGLMRGTWIPNGGTLPTPLQPWTLVVEAAP